MGSASSACFNGVASLICGDDCSDTLREPSSVHVAIATQSNKNARESMEDFTQSAEWADDANHPMHRSRMLAVFDGHGHYEVAKWLSENCKAFIGEAAKSLLPPLPSLLSSAPEGRTKNKNDTAEDTQSPRAKGSQSQLTPQQIECALRQAFLAMDKTLRQVSEERQWTLQGATAVVTIITDTHIISANLGDSRALIWAVDTRRAHSCPQSSHRSLIMLSHDHKPCDREEKRRIENTEGFSVVTREEAGQQVSRIWPKGWKQPNLNLSRAFGDFHCKPLLDSPAENPISAEPFIKTVALHTVGKACRESMLKKSFVLAVASDGVVNERFENRQLASAVQRSMQENWKTRVSKANQVSGPDFLETMSSEDWTRVAASVLATTKHSNGGDNQSIHLAHLTQHFDDQEDIKHES